MKLQRLPDWDCRLIAMTIRHLSTPPEWGVSDCLLTVADAIEAVTGVDLAAKIRGTYDSEIGAAKLLRRRRMKTVEDALAKLLPETGRLMAQRGDVGTIEREGTIAAGFLTDRGFAVKDGRGLVFHPQTAIRRAFKVG